MLGTLLNAAGILLGGFIGLTVGHRIKPALQKRLRLGLAGLLVYAGLSMVWEGIHAPFVHALKQLGIGMLALCLGNLVGRFLRLQRRINSLGYWAVDRFAAAAEVSTGRSASNLNPKRWSEGFVTCTLIFCIGPMAILGSIQDGISGNWQTLGLKGVLDGLATLGFTATYGWGTILAALPVLVYQGSLTLAAGWLEPIVRGNEMKASLGIAGGLIVACISVVILEIRKVPLADYLPSLILAPLFTWFWLA